MREYVVLANDERMMRRTIADAIEIFREMFGFKEHDSSGIRIGLLRLLSDDVVGLIQLEFIPIPESVCIVRLPTSAKFRARCRGVLEYYEIARLAGAVVDGAGNVLLADGTSLRAVEIIPANLPLKPSELDWRIVQHTVSIVGAERRCYRHIADGLPYPDRGIVQNAQPFESFPDGVRVNDPVFLDCATLARLEIPQLKEIARQIARRDPTLKKLSRQKIADALRSFGIRVPDARSRTRGCHEFAAIQLG